MSMTKSFLLFQQQIWKVSLIRLIVLNFLLLIVQSAAIGREVLMAQRFSHSDILLIISGYFRKIEKIKDVNVHSESEKVFLQMNGLLNSNSESEFFQNRKILIMMNVPHVRFVSKVDYESFIDAAFYNAEFRLKSR